VVTACWRAATAATGRKTEQQHRRRRWAGRAWTEELNDGQLQKKTEKKIIIISNSCSYYHATTLLHAARTVRDSKAALGHGEFAEKI
jgi:hypothetical protein